MSKKKRCKDVECDIQDFSVEHEGVVAVRPVNSSASNMVQANIATFFSQSLVTPRNSNSSKRHRITPSSAKLKIFASSNRSRERIQTLEMTKATSAESKDSPSQQSIATSSLSVSKRKSGATQMYLDLGQKNFARNEVCNICGALFVHGVAEDLAAHHKVCRMYTRGVPFHSTRNARVVTIPSAKHKKQGIQGSIVEVRPGDSASLQKKADAARKIAHEELGFVSREKAENKRPLTTFLFVKENCIVGLMDVEPISMAYSLSVATLKRNRKRSTASMGVHTVWVHKTCRGRGIASRLLDAARAKFVYGIPRLPADQIAFSSPTMAGISFATSYLLSDQDEDTSDRSTRSTLLVYDCC